MMSSKVYKIIWKLIHVIFNLIDFIISFSSLIYIRINEIFYNPVKSLEYDLKKISLNRIRIEEKIPSHFVIILNENAFSIRHFLKLIYWCSGAGIKYISFYDYRAIFEDDFIKLKSCVENEVVLNTKSKPKGLNGLRQSIQLPKLNYITTLHGKDELVSLTQQFCYAVRQTKTLTPEDVNIDLIDRKLRECLGNLPDPELALYFGSTCSTFGLLPWQIRLTEFYSLATSAHLNVSSFLQILEKYAKCEQRFGK